MKENIDQKYSVSIHAGGESGFVATLNLHGQPADRIADGPTEARAIAALKARTVGHPVSFQTDALLAIESRMRVVEGGQGQREAAA